MKTYGFELYFTNFQKLIKVRAKNLTAALQKAAEKALTIAPDYKGAELVSGGVR